MTLVSSVQQGADEPLGHSSTEDHDERSLDGASPYYTSDHRP
jgi:hypothetical protein